MQVLILRPYRKDNIYFRTIEEREKIINKIYVGIVNRCLLQICNKVTTLDRRKNLVFAQYPKNEWTEFNYNKLSLTRSALGL